jgi:hypothetical protein
LQVVSIRIKSIENSSVSSLISFYDEDSPSAISEAIKKIDINSSYDSRKKIKELDKTFVEDVKRIIEN